MKRGARFGTATLIVLLAGAGASPEPPLFPIPAYPTPLGPGSTVVADFNGDGYLDVAVASPCRDDLCILFDNVGSIAIFLGGDNPRLTPGVTIPLDFEPTLLRVVNFQGPERPGLLMVPRSGSFLAVLQGTGDGTFESPVAIPTRATPHGAAIADFNADGFDDIAYSHSCTPSSPCAPPGGEVSLLLGSATGTFEPGPASWGGLEPRGLEVGDFNGDGLKDVAVGHFPDPSGLLHPPETLTVHLGLGDGTFSLRSLESDAHEPRVSVADFNLDGFDDIVRQSNRTLSLSDAPSTVVVWLSNGDGTFRRLLEQGATNVSSNMVTGLLTRDAIPDIAYLEGVRGRWISLLGDGSGSFSSLVAFRAAVGADPVLADMDGDGDADLVLNNDDTLVVLTGNGDGTFGPSLPRLAAGLDPRGAAVADFDRDGRQDLAVANAGSLDVSILLGREGGLLSPAEYLKLHIWPRFIAADDLNQDGNPDLLLAGLGEEFAVLMGQGNGTFGPPAYFEVGFGEFSAALADLDRDGNLDLALADRHSSELAILLGDGMGGFSPRERFTAGLIPRSIVAADFNRDGSNDLAVANECEDNAFPFDCLQGDISILLGSGDGTFGSPMQIRPSFDWPFVFPLSMSAADLNADGNVDLAFVVDGLGEARVLFGAGDGTFPGELPLATGPDPSSVRVADVDADGRLDLVVTNEGNGDISIFPGRPGGNFAPALRFVAGALPVAAALGDLDGDGRGDLAVVNGCDFGGPFQQSPCFST